MKVCISCQKDIEGKPALRVKEDRVIKTIRAIKKTIGIAQMNELYVCEADLAEHKKRRQSFEKSLLLASVLAGLIMVLVVGSLLLSGSFDLWAFASSLVVGVFILALPLLKYAPAVEQQHPAPMAVAPMPTTPLPVAEKAPKASAQKPSEKKKTKGSKKR